MDGSIDRRSEGSTEGGVTNRPPAKPPIRPGAHPPFLPVLTLQALTLLLLWLLQARYG